MHNLLSRPSRQGRKFRLFSPMTLGLAALTLSLGACQSSPEATPDTETSSSGEVLPGAGTRVTAAYSVLEDLFQTEVVNLGLEQLGYTIEDPKELEYATMHVDLANGGLDYTAVHWQQLHNEFFENSGGDEKLERLGVIVEDALQGYAIDKATADEYGITSLDQLQDPEIAALFDTDGDGQANLTGCNPGWGCELVIEHHLDEYGLRDTVQHDQGKYFALMADTLTRFDQGESILYYTWTPLWVGGVLTPGAEVEWLEVPYTSLPEAQGELSEEDTSSNGKNLGFAVDQLMVLANQEFADANPSAVAFMASVQVPLEDVSAQNQLMQEGEDSPEDIRRHAEEWVAENQDQFDTWVNSALSVAAQ
ncbi:MAG: glycine betaine/L-proline ABC transporter substrate-binding protein ProX [Prochlorothrix sp.]|nr:glycine betaine/L-proline ABC transporter substrate-binding protein ProX [Prochlorothrix sp.]